jgi:hypothetical protein
VVVNVSELSAIRRHPEPKFWHPVVQHLVTSIPKEHVAPPLPPLCHWHRYRLLPSSVTLSATKLQTNKRMACELGRKQLWPKWGTILAFSWRHSGKRRKTSVRTTCTHAGLPEPSSALAQDQAARLHSLSEWQWCCKSQALISLITSVLHTKGCAPWNTCRVASETYRVASLLQLLGEKMPCNSDTRDCTCTCTETSDLGKSKLRFMKEKPKVGIINGRPTTLYPVLMPECRHTHSNSKDYHSMFLDFRFSLI